MKTLPERISAMLTLYLPTDPVREAVRRIQEFRDLGVAGLEADCTLLIGVSGAGKSRILHRLKEDAPDIVEGGQLIRPMVRSELPARTTIKGAAETLWCDLGSVDRLNGSLPTMTNRVIDQIRERHTNFIAFDEAHHIVDKRSLSVTYDVGEWIKGLLNRARCPILLTGMPRLVRLIETNSQLARRCSGIIELGGYLWGTEKEKLQFQAIIIALCRVADIQADTVAMDRRVAECVHRATSGLIGRLVRLLEQAIRFAANDGMECLDLVHLRLAYDAMPKSVDEHDVPWPVENPFVGDAPCPTQRAIPVTRADRSVRLQRGRKVQVRLKDVLRNGPPHKR